MASKPKRKNTKLENFTLSKVEKNEQEKIKINNIIADDITLKAKNDSQKALIESIKNNQITICNGGAGMGKTLVSGYVATSLLKKKDNNYHKIYLGKSVTVLKGEDVGYLKGSIEDKIEPFMLSFMLNVGKLFTITNIQSLLDSKVFEPLPLAYLRGVTLDNCIIIVDEIQNISLQNIKTLMTRIGEDSKMILLGDKTQKDSKDKECTMTALLEIYKDTPDFGVIEMNDSDENCRNPIIKVIEEKFAAYLEKKSAKKQRLNG